MPNTTYPIPIDLNASLNHLPPVILNATLNQPSQFWWTNWDPLIILFITAVVGILTWGLTEWARRSNAKYLRKEQRYLKLIEGLKGYDKPEDKELKKQFIHEINLCWLYCPNNVIRKANDLLRTLNDDNLTEERVNAMSEFMLTIRKDALKRMMPWDFLRDWMRPPTELSHDDYKDLRTAMLRHYVLKVENSEVKVTFGDRNLPHEGKNGNNERPPKGLP